MFAIPSLSTSQSQYLGFDALSMLKPIREHLLNSHPMFQLFEMLEKAGHLTNETYFPIERLEGFGNSDINRLRLEKPLMWSCDPESKELFLFLQLIGKDAEGQEHRLPVQGLVSDDGCEPPLLFPYEKEGNFYPFNLEGILLGKHLKEIFEQLLNGTPTHKIYINEHFFIGHVTCALAP